MFEHKTIELFGKMLFEKVILTPPFKKTNPLSNEACFLYVIEGEYNSISEQGQMRIKTEESVLMKCGNYLSQMYASKPTNRYEAVAVHFHPDILEKIYENKLPKFLKEPKSDSERIGMGKFDSSFLIRSYIENIRIYFENPSLVNEELLILKLQEIILLLSQTGNSPAIHSILSNLFNPTTYTFREIIDAHIYSTISIKELAQLTNMSLSTFKREFMKIYNASPATYIKNKKLAKAADLLLIPELRISDVAYETGFNNVSHFSKSFKQKFGVSPSSYKLNHFE